MLGRPRIVDDESLAAKEGPVRMLFHSQAPDRLPKSVMLFANLQGFKIGVSVESSKGEGSNLAGPVDMPKDGKEDEGNEGERTEEQSLSDCHWKRRNNKDKEKANDTGVSGGQGGTAPKVKAPFSASTPPPTLPAPSSAPPVQLVKFQKKLLKKPGSKSSVGSSSVPPPSAKDHSTSKPASAPAKFTIQPIPFNQYGSNLEEENLFASAQVLQPEPISMTIILDEDDSPPTSEAPIDPAILKRSKLSAADRGEVGWESPKDWEFDNETLAAKIAKLKKKQYGEVDNPPSTPSNMDLAKEVAAAAQVSKAKRSVAVVSPVSGTRTSARSKGAEGQPILQKAVKRAAAKAGMSPPSTPPNAQFIAFSSTPDLVFMGIAEDCGIMLRDSGCSPGELISLVRAKEIAQAKLAEAIEREAAKVAATEVEPPSAQPQRDPTSVVGAPPHAP
jgi:hypothetical protein